MNLAKQFIDTMENPATAFWGLSISDTDFVKLKRGVRPRDMDDRWIFEAVTDEELSDKATTNGTTTNGATTDKATTDLELTDGEPTANEVTTDLELAGEKPTADEVTTDLELTNEEPAADEATTDLEVTGEEPVADEATTDLDEELTDEELSEDEELSDEELSDEELSDEELSDEAVLEQNPGNNISIIRSWSNQEFYRLVIKPSENGISAKIEAITWDQNNQTILGHHISEEQAKIDIILLCRSPAGCDLAAAPDHDPLLFSGFPRSWYVSFTT